jgi:hypothetical protein
LTETERITQSSIDEEKPSALADVAAATDRDRARLIADAERIARSITYYGHKASGLAEIAGALAATDPDRARLLADAERLAQSVIEDSWKVSALVEIAGALAATDPGR